jgi:hypothetical protein
MAIIIVINNNVRATVPEILFPRVITINEPSTPHAAQTDRVVEILDSVIPEAAPILPTKGQNELMAAEYIAYAISPTNVWRLMAEPDTEDT